MRELPNPPPHFLQRKKKILEQLAVPDAEYTDASPKGSVDAGIRELIDDINTLEGFVTTSSCAGRVSVFLEGRKASESVVNSIETAAEVPGEIEFAGTGGKGGGGRWLFVSHDPVEKSWETRDDVGSELLGLREHKANGGEAAVFEQYGLAESRLVHFKFEPMVSSWLLTCSDHKFNFRHNFIDSAATYLVKTLTCPADPPYSHCFTRSRPACTTLWASGRFP